jgi:peroxiredoxin
MFVSLIKGFKFTSRLSPVLAIVLTMALANTLAMVAGCVHQPTGDEVAIPADPAVADVKMPSAEPAPNYAKAASDLAESLKAELSDIATEEDQAIIVAEAEQLAQQLPTPGLKVGSQAPHFALPNAYGDAISLYNVLESGPVVLVFYRGNWCPFCNLHLRSLHAIAPQLEEKGAQLIAVTPQQPDESLKYIKAQNYPFELLSDLDYTVMAAFDLYFEVSPALQSVYKKFGVDLEVYNGAGRTALPVPGTFVIDQNGIIRAVQTETDYKNRMEPAAILRALDGLN